MKKKCYISSTRFIALKLTSLHHLLLDKDAVCCLDKAAIEAMICTCDEKMQLCMGNKIPSSVVITMPTTTV